MFFRLNKKLTQAAAQQLEIPGAESEYKYIPAFIGIEDVVALWDELGPFPQAVLGNIINSNEPALMVVTDLGNYVPASDECRSWAKRYVLKCWQKPRLRYAASRVNSRIGWNLNELAQVLFEDEAIEAEDGTALTPQEQSQSAPTREGDDGKTAAIAKRSIQLRQGIRQGHERRMNVLRGGRMGGNGR